MTLGLYASNKFISRHLFPIDVISMPSSLQDTIFEFMIIVHSLMFRFQVFEDINLNKKKDLKRFLDYCNYFFAIIFTLEFLIKLIGFGFIKYFTNLWNLLDVFIVAVSGFTYCNKSLFIHCKKLQSMEHFAIHFLPGTRNLSSFKYKIDRIDLIFFSSLVFTFLSSWGFATSSYMGLYRT